MSQSLSVALRVLRFDTPRQGQAMTRIPSRDTSDGRTGDLLKRISGLVMLRGNGAGRLHLALVGSDNSAGGGAL